jgi:hypothetical protein
MFSPISFLGSGGRFDTRHLDDRYRDNDQLVLNRFYRAFPGLKIVPQTRYFKFDFGDPTPQKQHPATTYLKKYKNLIKKGYDKEKAFAVVEAELNTVFESQREDMRVLRGTALAQNGDSYLDRAQRVAELESQLKMRRDEINQEWLKENSAEGRDSIEDVMALPKKNISQNEAFIDYQPVLYQINKSQKALNQRASLTQLHETFLTRTEKLMRMHQQRAHIHDGLKSLTDMEVIQKVTESPTKLKKQAKSFLAHLRNWNIHLDNNGNIVYSRCKSDQVIKSLQKNETIVRVTLMQADLEFEYPQKLEKMMVRSDMLKWLDEEERKLEDLVLKPVYISDNQANLPPMETDGPVLTYEDYYGITDDITKSLTLTRKAQNTTKIPFE